MTWVVKPTPAVMPRLLPLSYWFFALLLLGGLRVTMRWYFNGLLPAIPGWGRARPRRSPRRMRRAWRSTGRAAPATSC